MKRMKLVLVCSIALIAVISTAFAATVPAKTTAVGVQLETTAPSIAPPPKPVIEVVPSEKTTEPTIPTETTPPVPSNTYDTLTPEDAAKIVFFDTEKENCHLFADKCSTIKTVMTEVTEIHGNSVIMTEVSSGEMFGMDFVEEPPYQLNQNVTLYVLIQN